MSSIKYISQQLYFNRLPSQAEKIGNFTVDEFRVLIDGIFIYLADQIKSNNKNQLRTPISSPFNCMVLDNSTQFVVFISFKNAVYGYTQMIHINDNKYLPVTDSDEELEAFINSEASVALGMDEFLCVRIPREQLNDEYLIEKIGIRNIPAKEAFFDNNSEAFASEGIFAQIAQEADEGIPFAQNLVDTLRKSAKRLFKRLLKEENIMDINPIFKARRLTIDKKQVFYALDFKKRTEMFKTIKGILEDEFDLNIVKSGNRINPLDPDIMENIWVNINIANFVIFDISDNNPNVFYELGICHTLGKTGIMICDSQSLKDDYEGKFPFDMSHYYTIKYDNTIQGYEDLRKNIIAYADAIINNHQVLLDN